MTINFYDFPYDFDPMDNLLQECISELQMNLGRPLMIDVYGSYPATGGFIRGRKYLKSKRSTEGMIEWLNIQNSFRTPNNQRATNLWWTFENRRPPAGVFDGTISFDLDNYSGTNLYLPLVYQYLDISGNGSTYVKHRKTIRDCMTERDIYDLEMLKQRNFVSVFMNNPHPMRLRVIKKLNNLGEVAVFGRYSGRYVQDKIGTANRYNFNLCFENDLYPGYVTEKVLEAWLSESVPLYWGDDALKILNPKAIVNLREFSNVESFVEYVKHLQNSPELMLEILNQPLFSKDFKYSDLKTFMLRSISH